MRKSLANKAKGKKIRLQKRRPSDRSPSEGMIFGVKECVEPASAVKGWKLVLVLAIGLSGCFSFSFST
jgi:hypothetical protein